ncbi:MAG TPA: LuxR family transcriptional regulator [Erwinia persicina]|uniref:LuxR family transcriptional regulator n=1 Tax=Erwinia persicina TaxID=55211 RepID=A0A3S7SAB2_9GAMM|nr:PAS and helix-turn-helix domain-containing protein [Erwinia persicina]AXU97668.1 LuxR family transcriptional regulator [Erwinia persicina]MBC3945168.1 PAS domain-containing protein [Erwinia persicina]MBD8107200.1 PAS domain-containing protein [Erwinia persicina]MBD8167777.1 PAS domain-containing protein [Erwinia persicina]MBD8210280.1 PAS domain-containing protein [Erwinia persicina]
MELPDDKARSDFSALIAMMEHLSEPWGIKDPESRHLYMNKAAYLYTNTPQKFNIEGQLDSDFPASWAECEEALIEHDRRTLASNGRVAVIETHYWFGQKSLTPYVSEKIPLHDAAGEFIGIAWNAKLLDTMSPLKYITQQKPGVLTTEVSNNLFTRSELDTLFLMLQRLSTKEIARIYNLSHRTVENRIYNIYQKAGVHTLSQFEEYCRQAGLDNFIPDRLIEKGIQFI